MTLLFLKVYLDSESIPAFLKAQCLLKPYIG